MSNFKVGTKVNYPGYGLGQVTKIESKEILGTTHTFLSIVMDQQNMKVVIQLSHVKSAGLKIV